MVLHPCPKCNVVFNKKSTFVRHINRVFDCSPKDSKEENSQKLTEINKNSQKLTEINKNSQKLTEINKNSQKLIEMNSNSNPILNDQEISFEEQGCLGVLNVDPDSTKTNDISNIDESTFCCSYCNKKLVNKYSLLRHINESCKIKKENDEKKENTFKMLLERDKMLLERDKILFERDKQKENEINELKKQNKLFEEQNKILLDKIDKLINMKSNSKQSNTINNNQKITNNHQKITNNTQNNNIIMVNFGKEDLSIIDERLFIDRIIKKNTVSGVKIPDEILKIIHFNPMYPQLSNIYISDINREKCMVWEDGEWKLSNVDNIPQVMDKICIFSTDQINILREKYPNNKVLNDRLNVIEKYNNMIDEDYIQDLREDDDYNANKPLIKRAEDFQKLAYDTIKKTLYNEGKKLKKTIKLN